LAVAGTLVVTGTSSTIDAAAIGATTPDTGAFTTLTASGAVTFNDAGGDVDFRVEGDTDANLLFVDASADRMGIGTSSPSQKLDVNGAIKASMVVTDSSMGFRNRIINGDMRIDQRATSITADNTQNYYTVDRWRVRGETTDGVFTAAQSSTAPTGFKNSLLITVTTADASIGATQIYAINQLIEGYNTADLGWGAAGAQSVTLSFWVRSSLTGTFGGSLRNDAGDRSYPFTYTISAANTFEYKTITVAGDTTGTWATTTSAGVWVIWSLGVGSDRRGTAGAWNSNNNFGATGETAVIGTSGATFYITGVQLEAGSVATPFERRPYGTELVLCQRYYEKTYNIAVAPGTSTDDGRITTGGENQASPVTTGYLIGSRLWAVRKRAAPTIVLYDAVGNVGKVSVVVFGVSGSNNNEPYVSNSSEASALMGRTGASGTRDSSNTAIFHYTASAEL
jgi:hypothetical protein